MEYIQITGARENNLKNVSLKIPKRKITIFTGVSGSGKSSMVFDTIAQEAGRQLNETFPAFARMFMPKYSQPEADSIENLSAAVIIDQSRLGGNARSTLGTITDINAILRVLFSRFGIPKIEGYANVFSFNDPSGMCQTCEGIGRTVALNIDIALDMNKSLNEGAILLPGFGVGTWMWKLYINSGYFDNDKKLKDFTQEEIDKFLYAQAEKGGASVSMADGDIHLTYEGLVVRFARQNINTGREKSDAALKKIEKFTKSVPCPSCEGKRFCEKTLSSKINGYSIYDLTAMQISELVKVLDDFPKNPIVESLKMRVQGLIDIGLDYVTLHRETSTLSGGESQRVKMVKHLSSALTDVLYIFDEPSIGLHARDVHRLNQLLIQLRDKGNTVIVVEHDPDVIKIADYIVDMGPKAGAAGGEVVFTGSYKDLCKASTLTGEYIGKTMPINTNAIDPTEFYRSLPSQLHNLKNVALNVPKGMLTVVTGVAGSGKSTLVNLVFAPQFSEAVRIDQSPVAVNIRSNSATFTGVMDKIRKLFAEANHVSVGLFSYNSEGACEKCKGIGSIELNLSFMDNISIPCEVCGGKRYKREVLEYLYKGKNIVEVMEMTIACAVDFFEQKDIKSKLQEVVDVGLSYMTLGQPLSTLSGGECQRLKLAKELHKKSGIYILDEPTTGLHMSDVQTIIEILRRLVKRGNTVLVIEHNLDVMRCADWIVDLGPDGGSGGGHVLYEGPPTGLADCAASITGWSFR
ncbi:MAG: excinuclease ABC subunit UvrA [Defluviitaleaceae bacterium]|nr:excinuclease ABC subunit UvrA [Defluviitaleaceae bacterium]